MKIELLAKGHKLYVTDYTQEELEVIHKTFTVAIKGAFFTPKYTRGLWDGTKKYYSEKMGTIRMAKGFINILTQLFPEAEVTITGTMIQMEEVEEDYEIADKTLRDYQVEVLNHLRQGYYYGILNVATNGGKTVIATSAIKELMKDRQGRAIFLTHSVDIANQVYKNLIESLDDTFSVGLLSSSSTIKSLTDKQIIVGMVPTINSRIAKAEYKKFLKEIEVCVVDECHHASSDSFKKVISAMTNALSVIGLTGTVPTDKQNKLALYSVVGSPVIQLRNKKLIEKGVSTKPMCIFTQISDGKLSDQDFTYQKAYELGICTSDTRNGEILEITKEERKLGSQVLILTEHTQHSDKLEKLLMKEASKAGNKLGLVVHINGSTPDQDRTEVLTLFKQGKINVIIATSIMDEGIDISNIDSIIYARGGKSPRKLLQSIGRGLRTQEGKEYVRVYDFIDMENDYLLSHSRERLKVIKEEGFVTKQRGAKWRERK